MIKTLRITGFLVAIVAVGLFVFSVFFGLRPDEQIEEFLHSATVLDKFKQSHGKRGRGMNQSSPLVEQAKRYALYLNPPPAPPSRSRKGGVTEVVDGGPVVPPPPPPPSSVTFEVFGVSYYPSRPAQSLAWIVANNKEKRWARQGEIISRWTISEITEDRVTVTSGTRSADLVVQRPAEKSLLLKDNAVSDSGVKIISTASSVSQSLVTGKGVSAVAGGDKVSTPMPAQADPERRTAPMQGLLDALQGGGDSSKEEDGKEGTGLKRGLMDVLREYMKNPNAPPPVSGGKSNKIDSKSKDVSGSGEVGIDRVDAKESKMINDLGKELKKDATDSAESKSRDLRKSYSERRKRLSREAIERVRRRAQERKEP